MSEKDILRSKFSAAPEEYYEVDLFRRLGFIRKGCPSCGKFFWTLDGNRTKCPDPPCQSYTFIGNPPARRKFDYIGTWKEIESFFKSNGHTSVNRYPVVCRWRPDLYFTVASIVDFQRVEGNKIVFEFPSNPLIVPQVCLRFNDIANVGVSGKHFTSFVMVGQHALPNDGGYWKDRCIDLDFDLLTKSFGISPEEITFVEDVWLGYGAFGYSLEYFVRGLELGNAVFTEFEGSPSRYSVMKEKVVDMGAGLERFCWMTNGTPTSYDCVFGPVMKNLLDASGVEVDERVMTTYYRIMSQIDLEKEFDPSLVKRQVAKELKLPFEEVAFKTGAMEALYAVGDHSKNLAFAISDGALPSNVGGGYNLRVILRRALGFIDRFKWELSLEEVIEWHIDYLKKIFPELDEHREEIRTVLRVERERYGQTQQRVMKLVDHLAGRTVAPSEDELITLYDSEGITPDLLKEAGLKIEAPRDFYDKVAARHMMERMEEKEGQNIRVEGLPGTKLLFYEDGLTFDFEARVVKVLNRRFVVLDQTAFYARAGGQEPDKGKMGGLEVVDVTKQGDVVIHEVKGKCGFAEDQKVNCKVDKERRNLIMRHHTATHILNATARKVLGPWVWQHSAFKDEDKGRLDITHFAPLSETEVSEMEDLANQVIRKNLSITVEHLPRIKAETTYGFRIYQGGTVPLKNLRIVNVEGWDVEACSGTHCRTTGEVGLIKILRTERAQDGVVRLEFVAGKAAVAAVGKQDKILGEVAHILGSQREKLAEAAQNLKSSYEDLKRSMKLLVERIAPSLSRDAISKALQVGDLKVYATSEEGLEEDLYVAIGEKVTKEDPSMIYCPFFVSGKSVRLLVFVGEAALKKGVKASEVAKVLGQMVGGSGGGDAHFAQGGGPLIEKMNNAAQKASTEVAKVLGL